MQRLFIYCLRSPRFLPLGNTHMSTSCKAPKRAPTKLGPLCVPKEVCVCVWVWVCVRKAPTLSTSQLVLQHVYLSSPNEYISQRTAVRHPQRSVDAAHEAEWSV